MQATRFVFCRGNPGLMEALKSSLGVTNSLELGCFRDGETSIQTLSNLRKAEVVVFQSLSHPINENLSELLLVLATLRRNGASRVSVVMPYMAYARMDRFNGNYRAISAADVVGLIHASGAHELHLFDIHSEQVCGSVFGDLLVENHPGIALVESVVEHLGLKKITLVSPDLGAVKRTRGIAAALEKLGVEANVAFFDKLRLKANEVERVKLIGGEVKGENCLIVDDMIDTGGTVFQVAAALKELGSLKVFAFATHGLLCEPFFDRLEKSEIEKVFVSDSFHRKSQQTHDRLEIISIAKLVEEVVKKLM